MVALRLKAAASRERKNEGFTVSFGSASISKWVPLSVLMKIFMSELKKTVQELSGEMEIGRLENPNRLGEGERKRGEKKRHWLLACAHMGKRGSPLSLIYISWIYICRIK